MIEIKNESDTLVHNTEKQMKEKHTDSGEIIVKKCFGNRLKP